MLGGSAAGLLLLGYPMLENAPRHVRQRTPLRSRRKLNLVAQGRRQPQLDLGRALLVLHRIIGINRDDPGSNAPVELQRGAG